MGKGNRQAFIGQFSGSGHKLVNSLTGRAYHWSVFSVRTQIGEILTGPAYHWSVFRVRTQIGEVFTGRGYHWA